MQLQLFTADFCFQCDLFIPTMSNYGKCIKKGSSLVDRYVYEKSSFCEIDRRRFNQKLLNDRVNGKISHAEMYEKWIRE